MVEDEGEADRVVEEDMVCLEVVIDLVSVIVASSCLFPPQCSSKLLQITQISTPKYEA